MDQGAAVVIGGMRLNELGFAGPPTTKGSGNRGLRAQPSHIVLGLKHSLYYASVGVVDDLESLVAITLKIPEERNIDARILHEVMEIDIEESAGSCQGPRRGRKNSGSPSISS